MASENTNNNEAMKMEHEDATRIQACTRYLMGSLSAAETAAFEEHYFTCPECAEELKAESIFGEDVRAVFHEQAQRLLPASPAVLPQTAPGWFDPGWFERLRLTFALPLAAAVAMLALVIYQNAVSIPGLRSEVAQLSAPQSLEWVPLKLARGSGPVILSKEHLFWVTYFNLPASVKFPALCDIESSSGTKLKTVTLTTPMLGQPSSLLLRRSDFPRGTYKFKVHAPTSDSVVTTYMLEISPE